MRLYAEAVDYYEQAREWAYTADQAESKSEKLDCLEHAADMFEYAGYLGIVGGYEQAEACRKKMVALQ